MTTETKDQAQQFLSDEEEAQYRKFFATTFPTLNSSVKISFLEWFKKCFKNDKLFYEECLGLAAEPSYTLWRRLKTNLKKERFALLLFFAGAIIMPLFYLKDSSVIFGSFPMMPFLGLVFAALGILRYIYMTVAGTMDYDGNDKHLHYEPEDMPFYGRCRYAYNQIHWGWKALTFFFLAASVALITSATKALIPVDFIVFGPMLLFIIIAIHYFHINANLPPRAEQKIPPEWQNKIAADKKAEQKEDEKVDTQAKVIIHKPPSTVREPSSRATSTDKRPLTTTTNEDNKGPT